ncbi:MAG: hypothetical protein A3G21_10130 [Acidobacteria bacterium RIFCSPLOWO2_12_FULL_66_21]|nr:MAG: hypothetical protein A3G21_10130 [Acidobacteria bacterium RIFCSPLOWO2_12_FULL_66_21]
MENGVCRRVPTFALFRESGKKVAAPGEIYVYNPSGRLIDTIETPERPIQLVFGGKDGRTLFIAARSSLYSVRTRVAGR